MEILIQILSVLATIFMLSGVYLWAKIKYCKGYDIKFQNLKVDIIIPARNEEHNISKLLQSINTQRELLHEVIVVNDSSTDKTKEIALENGAKVIDSEELPKDWFGKPWACYQGAQKSEADIFIFLDADIEVEPRALGKLISTFIESSKNKELAMSVLPYHKIKRLYEEFSALFNSIMASSANSFTLFSDSEASALFGQSLIIKKETYFKIDGHKAVKDKILENVYMASKLKEIGVSLSAFAGKGILSFRMYPLGIIDLINGWAKAFASGASETKSSILINSIFWISSGIIISVLTIYSLFETNYLTYSLPLYFIYSLHFYWIIFRLGSYRIISSFFFPIHLIFYNVIFFLSLYKIKTQKSVKWKSRDIVN